MQKRKKNSILVHEESLEQRLEEVIHPLAKAMQLDVVDVKLSGHGAGTLVQVIIDKPGGVGIEDCEGLHQSVSRSLDVEAPVPFPYRLEVSSPGLDRPLKQKKDFQWAVGKQVRITLGIPLHGKISIIGLVMEVDDEGVMLQMQSKKDGEEVKVTWDHIRKARLDVQF